MTAFKFDMDEKMQATQNEKVISIETIQMLERPSYFGLDSLFQIFL